ncbi:MAG: branched-chain amino acid ABC transporter permease, partial [Alphaproteobacteria bacterium]|nr:branched-chain amino acid ABC transporter permease [Alphaproteobacteria bacterium]
MTVRAENLPHFGKAGDVRTARSLFAVTILVLAVLPVVANDYILLLAGQAAILVIAVAGLNILTGFTGLISLGHAAFFAIGAYVTAVGAMSAGLPPAVALPLSVVTAALIGIVIGLPALRVRGFYLAVATLSANYLVIFLLERDWLARYTGGVDGIEAPTASIFGIAASSPAGRYYLVAPFAVLAVVLTLNLLRTRIGRAFIAIRDHDTSAQILGISLVRYKLMSFAVSAGFCGLAGSLWAYYFAALQPRDFGLLLSIQFLAALIIGG